MKTVAEVAQSYIDKLPEMGLSSRWLNLVDLLNAFAAERVASLHSPCTDGELHQACQCLTEYIGKVRAEALEEAVNILQTEAAEARANKYEWVGDRMNYLAGKICALKRK